MEDGVLLGKAKTQGSVMASAPPLPPGAEFNGVALGISEERRSHLVPFLPTAPILAGKTPGLLASGR